MCVNLCVCVYVCVCVCVMWLENSFPAQKLAGKSFWRQKWNFPAGQFKSGHSHPFHFRFKMKNREIVPTVHYTMGMGYELQLEPMGPKTRFFGPFCVKHENSQSLCLFLSQFQIPRRVHTNSD